MNFSLPRYAETDDITAVDVGRSCLLYSSADDETVVVGETKG
jgi:hypothetical protein